MAKDSKERAEATLIDIPTAAVQLAIGISTLRRKIAAGEVPAYRLGGPGTAIRLDPQELDSWLRSPEDAAPGAKPRESAALCEQRAEGMAPWRCSLV